MKRFAKLVAVLAVLGIATSGWFMGSTPASDVDIKTLMGKNFSHMQKILTDLIRSDYTTVAHDVGIIEEHAQWLSESLPANAIDSKEIFLSMAFNLKVHANHLKLITDILQRHDKELARDNLLKVDYLRNSAAAHFGQIVTACVACHNQFRRRVVKN